MAEPTTGCHLPRGLLQPLRRTFTAALALRCSAPQSSLPGRVQPGPAHRRRPAPAAPAGDLSGQSVHGPRTDPGPAAAGSNTARIGLLPGSRRPELDESDPDAAAGEPAATPIGPASRSGAGEQPDDDGSLGAGATGGWNLQDERLLRDGAPTIEVHRGAFQAVLQSSDLVIGMAGTAVEQAVGLAGLPFSSLVRGLSSPQPLPRPRRRLLGPTVFCAPGEAGSLQNLSASAELCLQLLQRRLR